MGALIALLMTTFGLAALGGIFAVKSKLDSRRDKERIVYEVFFPTDLTSDRVVAYFRELGTLLHVGWWRGTRTMALSVALDGGQIRWFMHVPWPLKEAVSSKLSSLVPGSSAVKVPWEHTDWTRVVELGEKDPSAPLFLPNMGDTVTSMLTHNDTLQDGEKAMIQVVITSGGLAEMSEQRKTDTPWIVGALKPEQPVRDRREKLSEPLVDAVIRLAARADTPVRAKKIVDDIGTSFRPLVRKPNKWVYRTIGQSSLIKSVNEASSPFRWTAQFNAAELLAVVAWPADSPAASGLPRGRSRPLPPDMTVPSDGIVVGHSTYPGRQRHVALTYQGGFQHTQILGGTGSGKTTLMESMAEQDMKAGHTVIVMEPKGDLFYGALARVPLERYKDVIIVDLQDTDYPPGFNPLQQGDRRVAASNLKNLFEHQFSDLRNSIYARSALHRGLETLISDPASAFVDIVPLFSPSRRTDSEDRWRDELIGRVKDYDVQQFWRTFNAYKKDEQERYAQPLLNRAWIINETPEVRNIFGQSQSSFTFEEVFKDNKIVLINLAGVPDDAASLTGTLFMQSIWTAIQRLRHEEKQPAYLYLDEFQSFLRLPIGASEMLEKSRSFKLGMRLAHQHLDQLKAMPDLSSAVTNNTKNKLVFQTSADDGARMAREFGSNQLSQSDFQNQRQFEAYARIMTPEGQSAPLSMKTLPPTPRTADVQYLRQLSREKYGRPRDQVIQDMRSRRQVLEENTQRRRPKISGEDW